MDTQNKAGKAVQAFGFIYFVFNVMFFVVICIMSIYTMIRNPEYWPGGVLLVFPATGMLAGRWIRIGKYGWWRSIIIGLSFLYFIGFILIVFVLGPQMEKLKAQKFKEMQKDTVAHPTQTIDPSIQPLFSAIYANDFQSVKRLIDLGQDVNVVDEFGQTTLHITQNDEIARLLIKSGADVNARDADYNMTPIFNKDVHLSKILVEAGADINLKSKKGNTPLMWYCYSGYLEGVKYLASLGADINVKNNDSQTAIDIAETFGHLEIRDYLLTLSEKNIKK